VGRSGLLFSEKKAYEQEKRRRGGGLVETEVGMAVDVNREREMERK
jgi:hypothetical protein